MLMRELFGNPKFAYVLLSLETTSCDANGSEANWRIWSPFLEQMHCHFGDVGHYCGSRSWYSDLLTSLVNLKLGFNLWWMKLWAW